MKTFLIISNVVLVIMFFCTIGIFYESCYIDDENYVVFLIFMILFILIMLSNLFYLIFSNKELFKLKKERRKLEEEIKIKKLKDELGRN